MEAKLNIANILKDKPSGTKLYADAFGELSLERVKVNEENIICTRTKEGMFYSFYNNGKYNKNGESILVPSKEMRNWSKFAWKKGDALSCGVDHLCIFEKWANEEYTEFYAKFVTPNYSGNTFKTEKWSKETNEAVIKQYISNIEEFKGGKLNITTLEIEKTQPEFKDGDIITITTQTGNILTFIFRTEDVEKYYCHAFLYGKIVIVNDDSFCKKDFYIARPSTEKEKQQLFDALAKEGKVWNAKKKQIVDLKPKWWTPKPFDRVITRNAYDDIWTANIFSHIDSYGEYVTIGCVGGYPYCLPYNEETAKLIGTTNNWKG